MTERFRFLQGGFRRLRAASDFLAGPESHQRTARPCLKIGNVPDGEGFFARQGDLTRQYFVYCKENQRSMAEKEPPLGHIDIFQTWPRGPTQDGHFVSIFAHPPPPLSLRDISP